MADAAAWAAEARKARDNPVYVCFEEPSDPMIWAAEDPGDSGWGGKADLPGTAGPGREYPASLCAEHAGLGCGWYRLIPEEAIR